MKGVGDLPMAERKICLPFSTSNHSCKVICDVRSFVENDAFCVLGTPFNEFLSLVSAGLMLASRASVSRGTKSPYFSLGPYFSVEREFFRLDIRIR